MTGVLPPQTTALTATLLLHAEKLILPAPLVLWLGGATNLEVNPNCLPLLVTRPPSVSLGIHMHVIAYEYNMWGMYFRGAGGGSLLLAFLTSYRGQWGPGLCWLRSTSGGPWGERIPEDDKSLQVALRCKGLAHVNVPDSGIGGLSLSKPTREGSCFIIHYLHLDTVTAQEGDSPTTASSRGPSLAS